MTPGERCLNCLCWSPPESGSYGMCRRFPAKVRKPAEEWCAEWAPVPVPKRVAVAKPKRRVH